MTRAAALFLLVALTGSAQDVKQVEVDAVVVDAAGKPVSNLTPADFDVTSSGATRAVQRLTVFHTVDHTSQTTTSMPALELTPDHIHRNTVIVVDDLCSSAQALKETRRRLVRSVDALVAAAGRAAILKSSGGSARRQQLTGVREQLGTAIDEIEFLGGGISPAACATAAWTAVAYAMKGLQEIDGRKAVLLMTDGLPAPTGEIATHLAQMAAQSAAAIYQTASAAPILTDPTGGTAGIDIERVLERESSYYVLGFTAAADGEFRVALRRPGLTLHTRAHALHRPVHLDFPAPEAYSAVLGNAMNSPFAAGDIDVRFTPLYANLPQRGPVLELLLYVGLRELSSLRDEKGKHHVSFDVNVGAVTRPDQLASPTSRNYALEFTDEEYRRACVEGEVASLQIAIPTPGIRQIRVVVADSASGRMGSANAFVDVPDVSQNRFAVSGIILESASTNKESPAVRIFRPGAKLRFRYAVYNAAVDKEGRSQLETQIRIYAGGQPAFTGQLSSISFPAADDKLRRQVTGSLSLDPGVGPGRYILHVTVRDKLAEKPAAADQRIDFTIE